MQSPWKKVAKVEALFACVPERNHSWFIGWHKWGVSHQLPALVENETRRRESADLPLWFYTLKPLLCLQLRSRGPFCMNTSFLCDCIKVFCFLRARTKKWGRRVRGQWLQFYFRGLACSSSFFLRASLQWNGNVEWAAWLWAWSLQHRQSGFSSGGVALSATWQQQQQSYRLSVGEGYLCSGLC